MPRTSRIDAPGALHHIIFRGLERRRIFRDDEDRDNFLDRLGGVLQEKGTTCYAWALIPNHGHLLLKTGNTPASKVMQRVLTGHAIYFNRRHHRHGKLFQNRYKSILCQEDTYLLELIRYIHLNPIRAGIVDDLDRFDAYKYTGHSTIMGCILFAPAFFRNPVIGSACLPYLYRSECRSGTSFRSDRRGSHQEPRWMGSGNHGAKVHRSYQN